jgi:hypothetical protein
MILAKIALGLCATVAVGTGYLVQDGFVHVGVDEYRADGTHVHLIVPAMAGPIAAYFVPERDLRGAERDLRPYLPMIREVAKELGKLPDTEFVEVRSGTDHVQIKKAGGGLNIEVESEQEHVRVWVPLRAVYDTATVFQSRFSHSD